MSFQPYCYLVSRPQYKGSRHRLLTDKSRTVLAKILLVVGLVILGWVAYPLASFQIFDSRQMAKERFLTPIGPMEPATYAAVPDPTSVDYTQVRNWFPEKEATWSETEVSYYSLSIPKLGIKQANVALSGEDLSRSLVHYGGTALPGKAGNGVVFGHSILPQFFNPKNYMAIFSTIHTLKDGDQIIVTYDGIVYQYQVIDKYEVTPKDISVLDQTFDDKYLTLITCTPPGTFLRRLVVRAKLVPH